MGARRVNSRHAPFRVLTPLLPGAGGHHEGDDRSHGRGSTVDIELLHGVPPISGTNPGIGDAFPLSSVFAHESSASGRKYELRSDNRWTRVERGCRWTQPRCGASVPRGRLEVPDDADLSL